MKHRTASGARHLCQEEMTRALRNRVSPYRRIQLRHPGRLRKSWEEHDAIVRAILAGNADAAREASKRHIAIQGDTFTDFMALLHSAQLQVA